MYYFVTMETDTTSPSAAEEQKKGLPPTPKKKPPEPLEKESVKNTLIKSFLSPAVITVLITGIAGPLAVNSVNRHIETLKLQKEVMDRVMDITKDTNFKNYDEVHKIKIISEMINENVGSFGLNFTKTAQTFEEIYKTTVNIKGYEKEIEKQGSKINNLENDSEKKQKIINEIAGEKSTLEEEKARLMTEKENLARDQIDKRKEFTQKILEKEQEIALKLNELQKKQQEKNQIDLQLAEYKRQNHDLKNKVDAAKKENIDLSNKIGEYQNVISRYGSDQELLKKKVNEMAALLSAYQTRINELNSQYNEVHANYETLHGDYKQCMKEKNDLEKELQTLKVKSKNQEKTVSELQGRITAQTGQDEPAGDNKEKDENAEN